MTRQLLLLCLASFLLYNGWCDELQSNEGAILTKILTNYNKNTRPDYADGYSSKDMQLSWKKDDPVMLNTHLHLPRFTLESYESQDCTTQTKTDTYTCLLVNLTLQRESSAYIRRVYLPAYLLVALSWIAFWLNLCKAQTLVRIQTQIVSLLGLLYLYSVQEVPRVSYTTKLDTFFIVSVFVVIVAFVLNLIIIFFSGADDESKSRLWDKVEWTARIVLPVIYTVYFVIYLLTLG